MDYKIFKKDIKIQYNTFTDITLKFLVKVKFNIIPVKLTTEISYFSFLKKLDDDTLIKSSNTNLKEMFLDYLDNIIDKREEIFQSLIDDYIKDNNLSVREQQFINKVNHIRKEYK